VLRKLKYLFKKLEWLPFHPQWQFSYLRKRLIKLIKAACQDGTVLDIGCGTRWAEKILANNTRYIGLDLPLTGVSYDSRPTVSAKADQLPFKADSIENVLILDVLEHCPSPDQVIKEISRILKPGGRVIIEVPFIYPIHDAPFDYQRWTRFGLEQLIKSSDLKIATIQAIGSPFETAAIIKNLSNAKTFASLLEQKDLLLLLIFLLPITTFINNIFACLLTLILPKDETFAFSYQIVASK